MCPYKLGRLGRGLLGETCTEAPDLVLLITTLLVLLVSGVPRQTEAAPHEHPHHASTQRSRQRAAVVTFRFVLREICIPM